MSMDDILKILVESRQQGGTQSSSKGSDPMTELIGGLLGGSTGGGSDAMAGMLGSLLGGGQQPTSTGGSQQQDTMSNLLGSLMGSSTGGNQTSLGGIMSLLEMVTGGGQQAGNTQTSSTSSNPIMGLIQPFITPLANKLKISPQLAMIVVSFVLQKLLAHHPTSGRNSTQFDLDQMLNQLNSSGKLDPNLLKNSGMVEELSQVTGMNPTLATKSLNTAFAMVGKRALKVAASPTPARKASGGVKRSV